MGRTCRCAVHRSVIVTVRRLRLASARTRTLLRSSLPLTSICHCFRGLRANRVSIVQSDVRGHTSSIYETGRRLQAAPVCPRSTTCTERRKRLRRCQTSGGMGHRYGRSVRTTIQRRFSKVCLDRSTTGNIVRACNVRHISVILSGAIRLRS